MQTRADKIQWIKDALSGKLLENHKKELRDAFAISASCDLLELIINVSRNDIEPPDFMDAFGPQLKDCKSVEEVEAFVLDFISDHKLELSKLSANTGNPCEQCNGRCLR